MSIAIAASTSLTSLAAGDPGNDAAFFGDSAVNLHGSTDTPATSALAGDAAAPAAHSAAPGPSPAEPRIWSEFVTDPDCTVLGDLCYTWSSDICTPLQSDYHRRLAADPTIPTETWTVGRVVHYRTDGPDPGSTTVTAVDPPACRNTAATAPTPQVTAATVARAFATLPLPVPTAHMNPPFPACVRLNTPNDVYVGPVDTAPITVTLLGTPVTIYPRILDYTWDFGDGEHLTTTDPGAPYPHGTVSHVYLHPGRYPVTVTIRWAADWETPTHPRSAVPGQASTTSAPGTAWAHEIRVILVNDPHVTFPAKPHDPADACYQR